MEAGLQWHGPRCTFAYFFLCCRGSASRAQKLLPRATFLLRVRDAVMVVWFGILYTVHMPRIQHNTHFLD